MKIVYIVHLLHSVLRGIQELIAIRFLSNGAIVIKLLASGSPARSGRARRTSRCRTLAIIGNSRIPDTSISARWWASKITLRFRSREEADPRSSAIPGSDRLRDLGIDRVAISDADRVAPARNESAEMNEMLAAHPLQPFELGERIGMIVDPQIEVGPLLLAMDQQCGRLLAALIAAGCLAGLHGGDQTAREGERARLRIGGRGLAEDARPRKHVAGKRAGLADKVAAPLDASRPGMGADATSRVHRVDLAMIAAFVGRNDRPHHLRGRHPVA